LKKKRQAADTDIANFVDTEVLMASNIEDNTSQGKDWRFDLCSTVHVCS